MAKKRSQWSNTPGLVNMRDVPLSAHDRRLLASALECYAQQMKHASRDPAHTVGEQSMFYDVYEECVRLLGVCAEEVSDGEEG